MLSQRYRCDSVRQWRCRFGSSSACGRVESSPRYDGGTSKGASFLDEDGADADDGGADVYRATTDALRGDSDLSMRNDANTIDALGFDPGTEDARTRAPDGSSTSSGCPSIAPVPGAACSDLGVQCEYGANVQQGCNEFLVCARDVWVVFVPSGICGGPGPGQSCPAAYTPTLSGSDCSSDGGSVTFACAYPQGTCYCQSTPNQRALGWICVAAPPGCPATPPESGQSCSQEGLRCDYGFCYGGASLVCASSIWNNSGGTCRTNNPSPWSAVQYQRILGPVCP